MSTRRMMAAIAAATLVGVVSPRELEAQATAQELAKCSGIFSSILRLECYDLLARRDSLSPSTALPAATNAQPVPAAAIPAAPAPKPAAMDSALRTALGAKDGDTVLGRWLMNVTTDPITDRKDVNFILPSVDANSIDTPALVIRCIRGELDVVVSPDAYLSDGNNEVMLRFGSEPATRQRWSESSNHSALFHPGGRVATEAFVRRLVGYARIAIQVQPYQKLPKALVFELEGADQVNAQLWPMCPKK